MPGYFILIVGVGLALWQTGVLNRVAPIWIGIGAIIAVGIGIMLSVSSGKPTVTEEFRNDAHIARTEITMQPSSV